MKSIFYYIREYQHHIIEFKDNPSFPQAGTWEVTVQKRVATVCLLMRENTKLGRLQEFETARGFAVCSRKDNFCKRIGRAIAEGRARMALEKKRTCGYMMWPFDPPPGGEHLVYKYDYSPFLTDFEKKLVNRFGPVESHETKDETEAQSVLDGGRNFLPEEPLQQHAN